MIKRVGGCLFAGLLTLSVWVGETTTTSAQEGGDQWFIIDEFSGLDLYGEETELSKGTALLSKNVQFRKPGVLSVLETLIPRDSVSKGAGPINGMWFLDDQFESGRRLIAACSTLFWVTSIKNYGWSRGIGEITGNSLWRSWTDSTRVQDTGAVAAGVNSGRAADFWRAGWRLEQASSVDTIDYISDNNTFFLNDASPTTGSDGFINIIPGMLANNLPVKYVPIEANGTRMVVCLQGGMEPVVYRGQDGRGFRYFGVADSGTVQKVNSDGTDSSGTCYIVDNTKLGLVGYGRNELFTSRYWLHLPYYFADTDSSHWGRIWPIDSNNVVSGELRIYFSVGDTITFLPGGKSGDPWLDSLRSSGYQIISAPFLRDVLKKSASPSALIIDGGTYMKLSTGTIDARAYDHTPHVVFLEDRADTISSSVPDTLITCQEECVSFQCGHNTCQRCFTVCDTAVGIVNVDILAHIKGGGMPIRVVFKESDVGTDSTFIWTSRTHPGKNIADFTTSDWSISRATIPFASDGVVFGERLFLAGDPQDPNFVCFSDVLQPGAFRARNFFHLGSNGDVFVAFAKIYDWLVIFQEDHTWILKNDPLAGGPVLALPDEGCIAPKSIIELENHIIYLSAKGWRIFDGNTSQDFGRAIKPAVQSFPRTSYSVAQGFRDKAVGGYDASTGNVWLSMTMSGDTVNTGSFLQNFVTQSFSFSDEVYGDNIFSIKYDDTLHLFFTSGSNVFTYGYGDSVSVDGIDRDSMNVTWSTGWLDFGHPEQSKYVQDGSIHVLLSTATSASGATGFTVNMYQDFDTAAFYTETVNVFGYISSVYHITHTSMFLAPNEELQWLRIEIKGVGLNVMDVRRLALRYSVVGDIPRNVFNIYRPE